ncbi:uncharacterized protein EV422DRAFT_577509 [Fimicolochytrium jonesii]|uniref:uncharacterized protein n=1 Tax=Fimicolochytrium jonesii TaxID=1396493 RepID=UPI0022FE6F12|nr:uncharacterized protein EV422DRAFT_577509 [Fimicolochytrium jonesii]KAI8822413.1 hypothetical protein EV422DRAFT_577509 [Fimicolochytrium jonesii]
MSGYYHSQQYGYEADPNAQYYGHPQEYEVDPSAYAAYAPPIVGSSTVKSAGPVSYSAQPVQYAAQAAPTSYTGAGAQYYAPPTPYYFNNHGSASSSSAVPYPSGYPEGDSGAVPYPTGYTVESESGAVPYPEGYTPSAASATVVRATANTDDNRRAAALAALPAMPAQGTSSGTAGAAAAAAAATTGARDGKTGKKRKTILRAAGGEAWEDQTLLEWDANDFRLFCGDLGNEVTDDLLLKAFAKYPSVLRARVVRDYKSNKSKGYGFVSFKDPNDFVKAMKEMNGKYVGNRPIKLRKSTWSERNIDIKTLKKVQQTAIFKPVLKMAPKHPRQHAPHTEHPSGHGH